MIIAGKLKRAFSVGLAKVKRRFPTLKPRIPGFGKLYLSYSLIWFSFSQVKLNLAPLSALINKLNIERNALNVALLGSFEARHNCPI